MKEVIDNVLVVKVGTKTLTEKRIDGSERLDTRSFERIGQQILALRAAGTHVVVVSSGAITAGMMHEKLTARPSKVTDMTELQRLAAIGWRQILNAWDNAMDEATTGSVLVTQHDFDLFAERSELLRVSHTMLAHGDIVVANENDVIAHAEIAFGDNDTLAATYAASLKRSGLFGNVGLVILSDVHGLYEDKDDARTLIRIVDDIATYKHVAGGAGSANGTGGMKTKFAAAEIAGAAGVNMWVANGRAEGAITRSMAGEIGTAFLCRQPFSEDIINVRSA